MKTKLEHAVLLANRGFMIFPLSPNSKYPLKGSHWREESTNHLPTIKKWWSENPDYNVGIDCGKSGIYVIDVDTKEGKVGQRTYLWLDDLHGFDATMTAVTATGGRHLIYNHYGLGNTASALGKDIDTRGEGGYIVGAGSTINGASYYFDETAPSVSYPLMSWVVEYLKEHTIARRSENRGEVISEDSPTDIERAKHWLLEAAELAVEGAGGDHTTFATAAKLREFGLSADTTLSLMLDHWNDRCSPPWGIEDLQRKVDNAYSYAQRPQGAASAQADFDAVLQSPPADFMRQFYLPNESTIPPRDWIVSGIALRGQVTVLAAPPGVGKSTFMMTLAVQVATGRNLLDIKSKRGRVALWNNEDDTEELQRRFVAICKGAGITALDLLENDATGAAACSMLHVQSGEQRRLRIAQRAGTDHNIKPKDVDDLVSYITENKIDMLVVDPFSETHPAAENSNEEMQAVAVLYREVAQRAHCSVFLVHHDRKPAQADASAHIGNMYAARGASSLAGVARIMLTLYTMPEKDAKLYGVPEEERRFYMRLDLAKANMSIGSGEPSWFKRVGVVLNAREGDPDSGESVGTVVAAKLKHRKLAEGSAQADLIKDVVSLVCDRDEPEEGLSLATVVNELVSAYPQFMGKNPDSLRRAIKRVFSEGDVPVTGGILRLVTRERQRGEANSKPRDFLYLMQHEID